MAIYKSDIVDINLESGSIHRSYLNHTIGSGDNSANRFGVRTFRNGLSEDLTGASCQAIFMNAAGTNIALTSYGTVSGNEAYVTLPQACYNVEGQFTLAIKLVKSGETVTTRIVDGVVCNTGTTGAVAPTSSVPTYQEILDVYAAMQSATSAANTAIAETFDATKAYPAGKYVINSGALYRLTADHAANVTWANTSKVAVNFGDELSSTKSAIARDEDACGFSFPEILENKAVETNQNVNVDPSHIINASGIYCCCIPCVEGDVFYVTGSAGTRFRLYAFSKSNGDVIEQPSSSLSATDLKVIAPPNSAYFTYNSASGVSREVVKGTKPKKRFEDIENDLSVVHSTDNRQQEEIDKKVGFEVADSIANSIGAKNVIEDTQFSQINMGNVILANVLSENSVSISGKNLFSDGFDKVIPVSGRAEITIIDEDTFSVEAKESAKYNTVWFVIPNGRALVGKYISLSCSTPEYTSGMTTAINLAWVSGTAAQQYICSVSPSNNWVYNNKLIGSPPDDSSELAVLVSLSGSTAGNVGDTIQVSNFQFEIGIEATTYSRYEGIVSDGSVYSIVKNGVCTFFSTNNFDIEYYLTSGEEGKALFSKKILIIGDSISTGPSSAKRIAGTNYNNYDKWVDNLISDGIFNDNNVFNSSIHASGFVAENEGYPGQTFYYRLSNIADKSSYDYVIVFGGINDFIQGIAWETFTSAVDQFMEYMVNNFTQARLIIITPLRSSQLGNNSAGKKVVDYADYIRQSAQAYCLPIIDGTVDSGFCPFNTAFKNMWTDIPSSGSGAGNPDGLHPNATYMNKFLAPYLAKNILKYAIE